MGLLKSLRIVTKTSEESKFFIKRKIIILDYMISVRQKIAKKRDSIGNKNRNTGIIN